MYGKALMILPMKTNRLPKGKEGMKEEICDGGDYFGQLKKDGFYYTYEKDADGNSFLFSRVIATNGYLSEKSANVPHIMEFLDARVPNSTIIIGEIYYPNKTSKDVSPIMGCKPEKAIERQNGEYGFIHYYMHDMLMWDGTNYVDLKVSNIKRYYALSSIVERYELTDAPFMEFAVKVTHNLNAAVDKALEDGEEGFVVKKKDALYCPDKKPVWNYIKFKMEDDHDVICIGFDPPKERYEGSELETWKYWRHLDEYQFGEYYQASLVDEFYSPISKSTFNEWIGALQIGVYKDGIIVSIGTVSSGITDALCEEIKADPSKYLNKPLAVKCMMSGDDALRHASIYRWRMDDLNINDCTYEKIFG